MVAVVVAAAVVAVVVVTDMVCGEQNRLLLQFHITGVCNLRCKHCYRTEGNVQPLSLTDVIGVLEQFKELVEEYNRQHQIQRKAHINLTGGEPFCRSDIGEILEYLGRNSHWYTYGILSNGSFIDDSMVALLRKTQVSFVQLSIDGNRKLHDSLRAPGNYDRVWNVAEYLEQNGIRAYISFTANRANYRYLPVVARECRRRGITKLWSDRLVPIGNGQQLQTLALTAGDMPRYIRALKRARGGPLTRKRYPKTQVTMNRALQFQRSQGDIYSCSAGRSLITVDEFGNIMPCRRMPIVCGNVLESSLTDVYYCSDTFRKLRKNRIPQECIQCKFAYLCRGGARCQSYAKTQSFCSADPACGLVSK